MLKLKQLFESPHIQIAVAAGISILAIAASSAWILSRPIDPLLLTIPVLIEVIYEGLSKKYEGTRAMRSRYWAWAIILSTALLISLHYFLRK